MGVLNVPVGVRRLAKQTGVPTLLLDLFSKGHVFHAWRVRTGGPGKYFRKSLPSSAWIVMEKLERSGESTAIREVIITKT